MIQRMTHVLEKVALRVDAVRTGRGVAIRSGRLRRVLEHGVGPVAITP